MKKSRKANIVDVIINIAKHLEGSKLKTDVVDNIKEAIDQLSTYLNTTKEEALLFAVIFALQVRINIIDLRDIINFLGISYIDSIRLKSGIDSLLEKNLIELEEENGRIYRKTKYGKSSFSIPNDISDQIYANQPIRSKELKQLDIYVFIKTVSDLVQKRKFENISTLDLFFLVDELEEKNKHLPQLTKIKSKLTVQDRTLIYEMLNDRVTFGAPTSELQLTIGDIYDNARERRLKIRQLVEKSNPMFTIDFIELTSGNMTNDSNLMLTNTALEFFLEEDAELFIYTQKARSTIVNERISKKELFFDASLNQEIEFLTQSLIQDNFTSVQERLDNMGLPKGVAAIFYGSPGTGKTESVFQIAKQTGRDIFKVDISHTKSMWYGESEKKIKSVFTEYERTSKQCPLKPILLFNEADAILGKRQENSRSNVAQTENTIQNILLEELERFEGIMIATTNLQGNLDTAFERRFLFKIKFEVPSTEVKTKIWNNKLSWLNEDLAIKLAKEYSFSPGEIDNIVRKIAMKEILTGIRPDTSEILHYCQNEKLNSGSIIKKVGFV
jgi:AAA+ superfamily predicted ATPase